MNTRQLPALRLGGLLLLAAVTGSAALLAAAPAAHAQQDRNKAKKSYRDAKKAYDSKKFEEAAALFLEAYNYDPKPELLFNIGQAYSEAGRFVKAAEYLQRFMEEKPDAPNRDQVAQQLYDIQLQIATLAASVMVQAPVEGLEVFVDAEPEPRCVTPCLLTLTPITHQIKVMFEGAPAVQELTPEPGSEGALNFDGPAGASARGRLSVRSSLDRGELLLDGRSAARFPITKPLEMEVGSYPAAIQVDGKTVWSGNVNIQESQPEILNVVAVNTSSGDSSGGAGVMSLAGWSLGAAGVASLGAGLFFGLSATSIEDDLQTQLDAGKAPDQDLLAQGEDQAFLSNVFYGVGAGALIAGALLIFFDDSGEEQTAQRGAADDGNLRVLVAPQPGGGVVGVGLDY